MCENNFFLLFFLKKKRFLQDGICTKGKHGVNLRGIKVNKKSKIKKLRPCSCLASLEDFI